MYTELIYFENGRQIARVFSEFNDNKVNSDPENLWLELKAKIKEKENGNHKWNWREELKIAFNESFPCLKGSDSR